MPKFTIKRPPQDRDELHALVRALFGVVIPRHKVCLDHDAPFDAFADAYFGVNSLTGDPMHMAVWHASRGLAGKSKMLSILGLTLAFVRGYDLTLLGGSMAQSTNVHEYMRMALGHKNLSLAMVVDETSQKITLANRGRVKPLTASQKTVRGPHPSGLLMDEVDEMDLTIYDAALGQPMKQDNWLGEKLPEIIVASSTWQNADGTFTEVLRRAEEQGHRIYRWCHLDTSNPIDGWLDQDTIDKKRSTVSKAMWQAEYELGEPSIGNRAFDSDKVRKAFSLPFDVKHMWKRKVQTDYEEYWFEKPARDGQYVIAADWAKENDWTVIGVGRIDTGKYPMRLVAYVRVHRRPWPVMLGYFNRLQRAYGADGTHDKTGIGNVVNDYLAEDVTGFIMSGEPRSVMLSEFVVAVENDQWLYPQIPTLFKDVMYCRTGDLYKRGGPENFHVPDGVTMGGLLHRQSSRYARPVEPQEVKKTGEKSQLDKQFSHPDRAGDHEEWRDYGAVHRESDATELSFSA